MLPKKQIPFLAEKGHVVSLVGGGGKTTLLYAFARHCAAKGWRVLVSTTTHIRQPGENYAADEAALAALWAAGQYAVAGVPAEQGKLTALPPEQLTRWMAQADFDLLEERLLSYPALAIGQCHRAMNGMAKKVRKNVNRAMNLLNDYQQDKFDKVQR